MKTIEKLLQLVGTAVLLIITLLILSTDRSTENQRQLDEMVDYQRSQGRNAVIEDGYIVIKSN